MGEKLVNVKWRLFGRWWYELYYGVNPVKVIQVKIGKARWVKTMYVAPLTFNWTPTPGIVGQTVNLSINNVVQPVQSIAPTQGSFNVPQVKSGDTFHINVVENGAFESSAPTTFDYTVPDLTPPAPAGAITAVLGTVVQIPDTPPVPTPEPTPAPPA
jgi:hypothetical protein